MTGPPRLVLNRELSWLDFDARVLALAEDAERPLLERVKFLAISSRNLDEFFQVRVARLRAQRAAGVTAPSRDGLAPAETLSRIRAKVLAFVRRQQELFAKELVPGLAERGVQIVDWAGLVPAERTVLGRVFEERLLPELKPVSVDALHSIARVANLSLHIAVAVRGAPGSHRFARV